MTVVERKPIVLPHEQRVPILTTETDAWMPRVAEALVEQGKTVLLQCGSGPYILVGGVFPEQSGPEIMRLINSQKERPHDQLAAIGVPREEMSLWVAEPYQAAVHKLATALEGEVFGVIAPASERVPRWLKRTDEIHGGVDEKLLIWADRDDTGPLARFYRYLREQLGIRPEEFFLLATSANTHKRGTNIRFMPAYEQLGDKEGLAYAVMDVEEGKHEKASPPIITALPLTIGREEFLVLNARRGLEGHQKKVPQIRVPSRLGLILYAMEAIVRSHTQPTPHRVPHKISP